MKKEKSDQNAVAELTREGLYKENKWLWEENKKLKDKIATLKMYLSKEENVYCLTKENRDLVGKIEKLLWEKIKLEEENKKLREENDRLKNNAIEDMRVQTKLEDRIKELEQCNLNLQTWLDNKEKVNKSLREELEELKSTYVYDAKQVRDIC